MKPSLAVRRLLFLAASLLATTHSSHAQALYWDTNGTDPGFGDTTEGTWGIDPFWNTDPTGGGAGIFDDETFTTDNLNFGTATLGLPEGIVTVSGIVDSGNLTFGAASELITLTGGTINLAPGGIIHTANGFGTINSEITSSGDLEFRSTSLAVGPDYTTNLGKISNTGNVRFNTVLAGVNNPRPFFKLNEASDYTGNTSLDVDDNGGNNITLVLGTTNALPPTTVVTFANTIGAGSGRQINLNLNGHSQTLAGFEKTLTNGTRLARVHNTDEDNPATLTINNADDYLFRGLLGSNSISGGFTLDEGNNFGLVKNGIGTLTLGSQASAGAPTNMTNNLTPRNSYTGGTTVNAGTLSFLHSTTLAETGTHTFAAGTTLGLGVSGANAFSAEDVINAFNDDMTGNLNGVEIDATTRIGIDTTLGDFTFSDDITGNPARDLVKLGPNTLTLSGTSTYTGETHVTAGQLAIASTTALNGTSQINLGTTTGTTLRLNLQDLAITTPIHTANAGQTSTILGVFNTGDNSVPSVSSLGKITGDGNVAFNNVSTTPSNMRFNITLTEASDYTGNTTINAQGGQNTNFFLGVANALPSTTVLTLASSGGAGSGRQTNFNLDGHDQTLAGLATSNPGAVRMLRVHNTSETAATLTINDDEDRTFTGVLGSNGLIGGYDPDAGNNFGIVKNGTGTWTLGLQANGGSPGNLTDNITPVNSYTGPTVINEGTIALDPGASIASSASLTLGASGTLDTSAQATYSLQSTQPVTFTIDPSDSGSSGSIVADELDITDAVVNFNTLGTLDDPVYILATYNTLTGAAGNPFGPAPVGYTLDYAYEGDKIALIEGAPTGGFASWQAVNGTTGGFAEDHDGDGVANGIEYFLGGPNGNTTGFTALPGVENDNGTLSITWTMGAGYDGEYGTDFWVETSDSLESDSWDEEDLDDTVIINGNDVTFSFPNPLDGKNFARLKVTGP